jgi:hypothetical protein
MTDPKSDYMFLEPNTIEVAGLRLRPLTIATLDLVQKLKLNFQQDESDQVSESERIRSAVALAWIQSAPKEEVLKAVRAGKAEEAIEEFMFNIEISSFADLVAELNRMGVESAATAFAVEPKPGDKEEQTPPNS